MVKVKPALGLKVRDPKSLKIIPESGILLKEISTYWERRIQSGDVIIVTEEILDFKEENKPINQSGGTGQ